MSDASTFRRANLTAAFQEFVQDQVRAGGATKGLEKAYAERLGVSPTVFSEIKSGKRQIGPRLSRQIESCLGKEHGWLEQPRQALVRSAAEESFLDLALQAYRATNAQGRRDLRRQMQQLAAAAKPQADEQEAPRPKPTR